MKKIVAVAGAFVLAACGGSEVDEPMEAEIPEEPMVAAGGTTMAGSVGTYAMEDGLVQTELSLAADGSYTMSDNGTVVETGTWTDGASGPCLTAEGAEEACFTRAEAADGSVTMTDAAGETSSWQYQP